MASQTSSSLLFGRQSSLSGCVTTLQPLTRTLQNLRCHFNDEVYINGSSTGEPVPPFACKFCKDGSYGNLLAVVDEEGSIKLLDTRLCSQQSLVVEWDGHKNAVFDIAWVDGTKVVTASGDQSLVLWDTPTRRSLNKFIGHQGSVKSVDVNTSDPNMLVSGSRDGSIMVWDTRCSSKGSVHKPVNCINGAHERVELNQTCSVKRTACQNTSVRASLRNRQSLQGTSQKHGVTAVLFHQEHTLASVGVADGLVKLWDLRRTYSNLKCQVPPCWFSFSLAGNASRPFGFTSLVSDPYHSCLFASCTDDIIYMYDTMRLQKMPVKAYGGHKCSSFYVKSVLSPEGRYLLSGSSCGNAFIWDVDRDASPLLTLAGHTQEVTAVAWSPYQYDKLVTCTDACDIRVWRSVCTKLTSGHSYVGFAEHYQGDGHLKASKALKRGVHHRTPLVAVDNTISNTPMCDLLAHLPACLDTENKLSSSLHSGMQKQTTDSKTQNATGNGLLAFLNSKGASVSSTLFTSSKRSHNATVLPKLKRQRRDSTTDKPSHKQQSRTRRQKKSPPMKTTTKHHTVTSNQEFCVIEID